MIKDNIFSDVSDEELMELYQKYRIMAEEETERPLCFDQYILQYQRRYSFALETLEAWNTVSEMLLDEICRRKYPDTGIEYLTPAIECRGIEVESGDMISGTAVLAAPDDIRIIPQIFAQDKIIMNTLLLQVHKETLSYAIGREDCTGKTVFTGDIVEYDYMKNPYVIEFDTETYAIIARDPQTGDVQPLGNTVRPALRVIGNIYQNPEKAGLACSK